MHKKIRSKLYIISQNLDRKLGINLPYFLKNGFWVLLRYFILALSGLAISVGFARLGTKELLGQYQFILSFLSLIALTSLPGLNTAALKSAIAGQEGGIIKAVRFSLLVSLLGVPIVIIYGIYQIFQGASVTLGIALISAGILFPLFYAPNTWYVFYEGRLLFRSVSLRTIGTNIVATTSLLVGLYLKVNIFYLILIYLLTNIFLNWLFYFEVVKKIKNKTRNFLDKKYGMYVSGQKFAFSLSNNIPPLAISFLFGFDFLAIYHITYYAIGTISGFLGSLASLYMPLLFRNIKLDYKRIVLQNVFIGMLFLVVFLMFVKFFFILLYGKEYMESVRLAYFVSFLLVLMPLKIFLINFFTVKKRNSLIIGVFLIANIFAFLAFYMTKNTGFISSVSIYLYTLQILVIIPLLSIYFLMASKKIDSMRREIKSE